MAERDQQDGPDNPEVRESVDAFRRAGTAVSDGLRMLYEGARTWFERRHSLTRAVVALSVWFGGNWTYNRIAPMIFRTLKTLLRRVSVEVAVASSLGPLEDWFVSASVPVLLILLAIVVVQNRAQTRKLNTIESKMTIMSDSAKTSTDGGTRELPPTGPRAIGGAIIGAIVGAIVAIWFGPGSILAGAFLGFTTGDKWDIRAYEESPLTPDLNRETRVKE